MPPALSSQAKAPKVALDLARANDPEFPGVACEGLLERFASRAREICGVDMPLDGRRDDTSRPVEFQAVNWMAFERRGRLVLQFEVHGGKFVRVALSLGAEGRFIQAAIDASTLPASAGPIDRDPLERPERRSLTIEQVQQAWESFCAGEASLAECAARLVCDPLTLRSRLIAIYGDRYKRIRYAYTSGRHGERVRRYIAERLGEAPVLKPNGKIL